MEDLVSLRPVKTEDLPVFFVHQLDPEATRLAAFPSRDRDAFFTHWTTTVLGNPANLSRTILAGDQVAGNIGAWTDAASNERFIGYYNLGSIRVLEKAGFARVGENALSLPSGERLEELIYSLTA